MLVSSRLKAVPCRALTFGWTETGRGFSIHRSPSRNRSTDFQLELFPFIFIILRFIVFWFCGFMHFLFEYNLWTLAEQFFQVRLRGINLNLTTISTSIPFNIYTFRYLTYTLSTTWWSWITTERAIRGTIAMWLRCLNYASALTSISQMELEMFWRLPNSITIFRLNENVCKITIGSWHVYRFIFSLNIGAGQYRFAYKVTGHVCRTICDDWWIR